MTDEELKAALESLPRLPPELVRTITRPDGKVELKSWRLPSSWADFMVSNNYVPDAFMDVVEEGATVQFDVLT